MLFTEWVPLLDCSSRAHWWDCYPNPIRWGVVFRTACKNPCVWWLRAAHVDVLMRVSQTSQRATFYWKDESMRVVRKSAAWLAQFSSQIFAYLLCAPQTSHELHRRISELCVKKFVDNFELHVVSILPMSLLLERELHRICSFTIGYWVVSKVFCYEKWIMWLYTVSWHQTLFESND